MNISKEECFDILNKHLKLDASAFWTNALKNTDLCRFTTSFQFYSFEDKLKQYYFTSNNVRFGNALEEIVRVFLEKNGAQFLERRNEVEKHDCDQIFKYMDKIVLIEQKIRDDHDSSKKIGQLENFQIKKEELKKKYEKVYCTSWFIDDCLTKNKSFYAASLTKDYELCYGQEIECFLKIIFNDDRADGFVEVLSSYLDEYRNFSASIDIFNNVYIDYNEFLPAKLFNLLNEKKYRNEIAHYFFNDNIPYKEILTTYKKKRKTEYVLKIINLLEGELNG